MPSLQRSFSGSSLLSSSSKPSTMQRSNSNSSLTSSMSKAFKLFDRSSINGSKHANTQLDAQQEEHGYWTYLVIDAGGIRPREEASYSDHSKRKDCPRYREGTIVEVDRRRRSGWTQWLGVKAGGGWLFDVSPKDKRVRMIEAEVAEGDWSYEPTVDRVPLLPVPSPRAASGMTKTSGYPCLQASEVVRVSARVRPLQMKGSFLRLQDGRGWIMDFADGRQLMRRCEAGAGQAPCGTESSSNGQQPATGGASTASGAAAGAPEQGQWEYVVVDQGGLSLRSGPDYKSEKLPRRVEEGELVTVVERRPGDGTVFLRLEEPQGWAFDVQPGGVSRLRLLQVSVERGLWYYIVSGNHGAPLQSRCSLSDKCRVAKGPPKGSFIAVSERVRVGEATFLKVEGGWLPDYRQGRRLVEGPVTTMAPPPGTMMQIEAEQGFVVLKAASTADSGAPGLRFRTSPSLGDVDGSPQVATVGTAVHGRVVAEDWLRVGDRFLPLRLNGTPVLRQLDEAGVRLLSEPTEAQWAATKFFLLDKAQVQVTLLCQLEGTRWARVTSIGGNMEGWLHQRLLTEPRSVLKELVPGVAAAMLAPQPGLAALTPSATATAVGQGCAPPLGAAAAPPPLPAPGGCPPPLAAGGANAPFQAAVAVAVPLASGGGVGAPLEEALAAGTPPAAQAVPISSGAVPAQTVVGAISFPEGAPTRVTVTAAPSRR